MYSNLSPKRAASLRYGARLRWIKCILGLVGRSNRWFTTFNPQQKAEIEDACRKAMVEASKSYQEELRQITSTDQRTSAESRTYDGK